MGQKAGASRHSPWRRKRNPGNLKQQPTAKTLGISFDINNNLLHPNNTTLVDMSLWDRYFAPGDLRARRQALAPPPRLEPTEEQLQQDQIKPSTTSAAVERIDPALRFRRQNALFFGGLGFTMLSAWVTRRSLLRKRLPVPTTFTPSNAPLPKADSGLDAAEALGLATLNTVSVFMTAIGAGFIYFDIAEIEDLREKVRRGIGFDVYGGESDADKEIEWWVADVLSRKDGYGNIKEEIVDKLMEIERKEKAKEESRAMLGIQADRK
ncbi:hypothetical protein Q7P37_006618 [Cladosporium fusiforme]